MRKIKCASEREALEYIASEAAFAEIQDSDIQFAIGQTDPEFIEFNYDSEDASEIMRGLLKNYEYADIHNVWIKTRDKELTLDNSFVLVKEK